MKRQYIERYTLLPILTLPSSVVHQPTRYTPPPTMDSDPLASPRPHLESRKSFAPKQPVELNAPKNDPITYEELKEHDGMCFGGISSTRNKNTH